MTLAQNMELHETNSKEEEIFCRDLCRAFVESGTPLWKLKHSSIRSFFEKYTLFKTTSKSRIRSVYLEKEADREEEEMQMCLKINIFGYILMKLLILVDDMLQWFLLEH